MCVIACYIEPYVIPYYNYLEERKSSAEECVSLHS